MRLPMVSRAVGLRRADCRLERSPSDGVICTVSTPKVLRTTLPTSDEIGLASSRVARATSSSSSVWSRRRSALSSASRGSRRSPNSIARMSTGRERRIGREVPHEAIARARGAERHAVGLARRAGPRLGLDVEERVDAGRVGELDGAAGDQIAVALEQQLAAIDVGAAEQRAADRRCRAASGRRSRRGAPSGCRCAAPTARRSAGRSAAGSRDAAPPSAWRVAARPTAARPKMPGAFRVDRLDPERVLDVHGAGEHRRADRAAQRQVGVDLRAEALGIADAHVAADRGEVVALERAVADADAAAEAAPRRRPSGPSARRRGTPPASNSTRPFTASIECGRPK